MPTPKGTKLVKLPEEALTRQILLKCLELIKSGVLPTTRNIGPIPGCNRDRVLKIRNMLIYEGLINPPRNKLGTLVRHPMNSYINAGGDTDTSEDPSLEEQRAIQDRIQEILDIKKEAPDELKLVEIRECRSLYTLNSRRKNYDEYC